jgi:hypothetical protein
MVPVERLITIFYSKAFPGTAFKLDELLNEPKTIAVLAENGLAGTALSDVNHLCRAQSRNFYLYGNY